MGPHAGRRAADLFHLLPQRLGADAAVANVRHGSADVGNGVLKVRVDRRPQREDLDRQPRRFMGENFVDDERLGKTRIALQHVTHARGCGRPAINASLCGHDADVPCCEAK